MIVPFTGREDENIVSGVISGSRYILLAAAFSFLLTANPTIGGAPGAEERLPFEAGYGSARMSWRAGAKPGQVGTRDIGGRKLEQAGLVLGALHLLQLKDEPEKLLSAATAYTLRTLKNRVDSMQPGEYSFYAEPGKGVETSPKVRALVLRSKDEKVAIVRADLFLMHEHIVRRVADIVEPDTEIGYDNILLLGAHNHSAPHAVATAFGPWMFADAFDPRHFVYTTHRIAEAVRDAYNNLRPAKMRSYHTRYDQVQRNIIGPATIRKAPEEGGGKETISVGYPVDHFDDEIAGIRFDAADNSGDTIAFAFVLGLHPETLPDGHGLSSGEWPVHVEERVSESIGAPAIALPGPMGDIEPDRGLVNEDHVFWRAGFEALNEMSAMIAEKMIDAFHAAGRLEADPDPGLFQIVADIPGPADHPIASITYFDDFIPEPFPTPRVVQDSATFRLHLISLGNMLLVGIPAETVTDVSRNIKSRLGKAHDQICQGYIFGDAPEWVRRRVNQNFGHDRLIEEHRVEHPIILNFANGHIGYVVTRWEYENRQHYRQSLTPYGPGTAEHIAASTVELASSLFAGATYEPDRPSWHETDREGFEEVRAFLSTLDDEVRKHALRFPAYKPHEAGRVIVEPDFSASDRRYVEFRFKGGTNDMPVPRVTVEAKEENDWVPVARGPGRKIHVLYTHPNVWTARWLRPEGPGNVQLRMRATGRYRSDKTGGRCDPIWDPQGADRTYEAVSRAFTIEKR